MPELPEVETVKKALLKHLKGREIISCDILYPKMIKSPLEEFSTFFNHKIIQDIERKGKFLIFIFSDHVLISHLRMEGKYLYFKDSEPNTLHAKVVFHLDNNEKVIYDDVRCFGIMELHTLAEYRNNEIPCLKKLGPEPFVTDEDYLYKKFQSRDKEIKSVLLDQEIMTGLGNIYVDETLFKSKINPFRMASSITKEETKSIIQNSRIILTNAIEKGGSTVSSYHPENGVDGKFQNELFVYGRSSEPCKICQTTILKKHLGGRGTSYCPNCQHVAKIIGIYGKIASGKTTVLNYLKNQGYKVFSCDEYIATLYSSSLPFKKFLIDTFHEEVINDNGSISKTYIKEMINQNEELKKALENYLYPEVKKALHAFVKQNINEKLVFAEIPLLYEAHFEKEVDYVLGIDASLMTQMRNLNLRGSKDVAADIKLNQTNKFDENAGKVNYLIANNDSLSYLYEQIDKALLYFSKI